MNKDTNEYLIKNEGRPIITLAFPVFEISKTEINNILYTLKNLPEKVELVILSDNPDINDLLKSTFDEKCKVIYSDGNVGKYQLIKSNAHTFKSPLTKICDPDDLILINELSLFVENFSTYNLDEPTFIRFRPTLNVPPGKWSTIKLNSDKSPIRERNFLSVVNENSVIPTKDLVDFELNAFNQTKSSDVLLSLSHFKKENINVIDYDKSFYVYNFRKGLTGNRINSNLEMFNQLLNFLDIMIKYNDSNKMWSPSFFDYKWAHNFINNTNLEIQDKKEKMKSVFEKLGICAKQNEAWKIKWTEKELANFLYMLEKGDNFEL